MKRRILNIAICFVMLLALMPPIPADAAASTVYVNFSVAGPGTGTASDPYRDFETALANVASGGTIILTGGESGGGNVGVKPNTELLPLEINKKVTITSNDECELTLRSAGIILGADVTFTNVTLLFANRCHDAIFANGHTLTLNNVRYASGGRVVDVFAGGLYIIGGTASAPTATAYAADKAGDHGKVIITGTSTKLGNVYAGSMNGTFDKPATISVIDRSASIGSVYGSGALEGFYNSEDFFSGKEPDAPAANPSAYPVSEEVKIELLGPSNASSVTNVDGATGGSSNAKVDFSAIYLQQYLSLSNIDTLTVKSGTLKPAALNSDVNLSIESDGILDLSTVADAFGNTYMAGDFAGGGTLMLGVDDTLKIAGAVSGTTDFQVSGGFNSSALAAENHGYIDVSDATSDEGEFTFQYPSFSQENLTIARVKGVWTIVNPNEEIKLELESFDTTAENWEATLAELNSDYGKTFIFEGFTTGTNGGSQYDIRYYPLIFEIRWGSQIYKGVTEANPLDEYYCTVSPLNMFIMADGNSLTIAKDDKEGSAIVAGTYTIQITAPVKDGKTVTRTVTLEVEDKKLAEDISITEDALTKTYDGEAFTLSAVKGEQITWKGNGAATIEGYYLDEGTTPTDSNNSNASAEGAAPVDAGDYFAKVTVAESDIYESVTEYIPFTIEKADQTVPPTYSLTFIWNLDAGKYTAIIPEVTGALYSFDGTSYSEMRTGTCAAKGTCTAYVKYAETKNHKESAPTKVSAQAPEKPTILETKTYEHKMPLLYGTSQPPQAGQKAGTSVEGVRNAAQKGISSAPSEISDESGLAVSAGVERTADAGGDVSVLIEGAVAETPLMGTDLEEDGGLMSRIPWAGLLGFAGLVGIVGVGVMKARRYFRKP